MGLRVPTEQPSILRRLHNVIKDLLGNSIKQQLIIHLIYTATPDTYPITISKQSQIHTYIVYRDGVTLGIGGAMNKGGCYA